MRTHDGGRQKVLTTGAKQQAEEDGKSTKRKRVNEEIPNVYVDEALRRADKRRGISDEEAQLHSGGRQTDGWLLGAPT